MGNANHDLSLHPEVDTYLWGYFRDMRSAFSSVLGHLDTDSLSIALINQQNQLLFLSSNPAIEENLITHALWRYDKGYHLPFTCQNKAMLWTDLYETAYASALRKYKQTTMGLEQGVSIATEFDIFKVVLSYGFKSFSVDLECKIMQSASTLIPMGKYALRSILKAVPIYVNGKVYQLDKPKLTLIKNSEVPNAPSQPR